MDELRELKVSSIYLYIGDAVRYDHLPPIIAEKGVAMKSVATSIHTPTSFASIFTGTTPVQNSVWGFADRLSEDIPTILDFGGVSGHFSNTINDKFNEDPKSESILSKTLGINLTAADDIGNTVPPFVFVERGPGGHAPYGDFGGNAWEYFEDRGAASNTQFKSEYAETVEQDTAWFLSQVERLRDRGLIDETLVIYTSDHGELLGEGGSLGHNAPLHPKLIDVPTVFMHPELEGGVEKDGLLRHVDIFPTIESLLGKQHDSSLVDGRDITTEEPAAYGLSFFNKRYFEEVIDRGIRLAYSGSRDTEGMHVFPRCSRIERLGILGGKAFKSPKRAYLIRHFPEAIRFYLGSDRQYGNPNLSRDEAKEVLEDAYSKHSGTEAEQIDVSKEQLRYLGYL